MAGTSSSRKYSRRYVSQEQKNEAALYEAERLAAQQLWNMMKAGLILLGGAGLVAYAISLVI